jgi:hypothetical protein
MKFNIGDTIYFARAGQETIWITCPECLGSGRLRVIMGDESEVSIACECCSRSYEGSPGKMQTYAFHAAPEARIITGVEMQGSGDEQHVRYSCNGWSIEEENIFATLEEAQTRAVVVADEHAFEEKKKLGYKEKQHKTWAWHVRYYRSMIRDAKEQIARAEAKMAMVPKNVKEADKL